MSENCFMPIIAIQNITGIKYFITELLYIPYNGTISSTAINSNFITLFSKFSRILIKFMTNNTVYYICAFGITK